MEEMQDNPYLLASRWSRVGAAIIDSVVLGIVMLPLAYFTGGFDGLAQDHPVEPSFSYQLVMALLGFSLYCVVNWKLLGQSGQTVGKKAMKIKVVNIDGSQAKVQDLVFKRYAFMVFISYIPLVGGILNLINLIMIFGKQKRALHDRVAKTRVISS
ncbi:RDD family protein [Vibrio vulnificus]|uniref:RDD family protein n=1 Tax=Vibrio vulnificus TaxID=672 RepID=UPI001A1F89EF|nr:RDD family protein [Vibrio vulnificus]ELY5145887.1 RDD family protein [Vibrio vulnificus]MCA0781339.1 RDD family protein [Vibrio vulnificus]MCU8317664.1 RDD family protein [Vibrio vulnificus]NTJ39846.1 RDD family protein [Vibrio vulnificus]HAS6222021.1 RDD family protein [Vibrio vulnificus]